MEGGLMWGGFRGGLMEGRLAGVRENGGWAVTMVMGGDDGDGGGRGRPWLAVV